VEFSFRLEAGALRITTQNRCMPASTESISEGIGLANLRKRLEILFPGRYTLQWNRSVDIFTSSLTIQLP